MRTYGKSVGSTQVTSYASDKDRKVARAESDIRDIVGMIKGSSLSENDQRELLIDCAQKLLEAAKLKN
jgi:hypothetical protein